jgi:hypothetical protein
MKIWTSVGEFNVTEAVAIEIWKKKKAHRLDPQIEKKGVDINGTTVRFLQITMIGYECTICSRKHLIGQQCDMEIVGNCIECNKPVQRFVHKRNVSLGSRDIFCMVHRTRVKV